MAKRTRPPWCRRAPTRHWCQARACCLCPCAYGMAEGCVSQATKCARCPACCLADVFTPCALVSLKNAAGPAQPLWGHLALPHSPALCSAHPECSVDWAAPPWACLLLRRPPSAPLLATITNIARFFGEHLRCRKFCPSSPRTSACIATALAHPSRCQPPRPSLALPQPTAIPRVAAALSRCLYCPLCCSAHPERTTVGLHGQER